MQSYERARSILQTVADANPDETLYQDQLGACANNISNVLKAMNKPAEAMALLEESLAIRQRIVDAKPGVRQYQMQLAMNHYNLGLLLWERGKSALALAAIEKAREIRQKQADANPAATECQSALAASQDSIGYILFNTGKWSDALLSLQQALSVRQKLVDANPAAQAFHNDLWRSYNNIGNILRATGKPAEALASYEKSRSIRQKLADANPAVQEFASDLAESYNLTGLLLRDLKRPAEALAAHEQRGRSTKNWATQIPSSSTIKATSEACSTTWRSSTVSRVMCNRRMSGSRRRSRFNGRRCARTRGVASIVFICETICVISRRPAWTWRSLNRPSQRCASLWGSARGTGASYITAPACFADALCALPARILRDASPTRPWLRFAPRCRLASPMQRYSIAIATSIRSAVARIFNGCRSQSSTGHFRRGRLIGRGRAPCATRP